MQELMIKAYVKGGELKERAKNEIKSVRSDQRGMELLQVLIIILIVVLIAAALWTFLSPMITGFMQDILDGTDEFQGPTVPTN